MWRTCKEGGRPWPVISDDPVIDYMVMEAVAVKVSREDKEAMKKAEDAAKRKKFKEDREGLMQYQ
jgi:hypothetical protein